MQFKGNKMTDFIFLSKGGEDEYINMLARSAGQEPTDTDFFDYKYDVLMDGMTPVMRGILKYKSRCKSYNTVESK